VQYKHRLVAQCKQSAARTANYVIEAATTQLTFRPVARTVLRRKQMGRWVIGHQVDAVNTRMYREQSQHILYHRLR
jgi:hypothetical protein